MTTPKTWGDYVSDTAQLKAAQDRIVELEGILAKSVSDYDRRKATRWGRFLLWLLWRTT